MSIVGYTTYKELIAKLYRDLGINSDINVGHVIEWVGEVLEKIGAYAQYKETKECLELVDGKVKLPCGFYRLKEISYQSYTLYWATEGIASDYGCNGCTIAKCCGDYSFYINDSYIITDIRGENVTETNSTICITYLGIPVDDEGYPLIPNDIHYLEACANYVTYMLDKREWRKGQIADKVLDRSERDYLWSVGAAKGSANMPNVAQLEALKNVWVRLIPKQDQYSRFFIDNTNQEQRYTY
jgi:hypothetical protein